MKIYIQLTNGLGNQLFQVAFGDFLKQNKKHEIFYFKLCPSGNFSENNLIKLRPDIRIINKKYFNFFKVFLKHPRIINFIPFCNYEKTNNSKFSKVYFGFWQHAEYYKYLDRYILIKNINIIYNDFLIKNKLKKLNNLATIHIRGGDYLLEKHRIYHGTLNELYYKKAMSIINSDNYICITDDIYYSKKLIKKFLTENIMVENFSDIYKTNTLEDFSIMVNVKNGIIANSTFSWWAKVLGGTNSDIVAPTQWSTSGSFNINIKGWKYI